MMTYGGMAGFKFAQLYPHMVESMVMSSIAIEMTESISNASLKNIGFTNWSDYVLPKTVSGLKVLLSIGFHKLPWLPEFFYRNFLEAECLAKGMMKLGVEKFSLVGIIYGGMVGFKLAQLYPHMVESMVMSSTVIEMTESISNASLKNIGFTNWSDFLLPKTVSGVKVLLSIGYHKLPWFPQFFYRDFLEVMFDNRKEKEELLEALVVSDKDATITDPNYSQKIYLLYGDDDKIFHKTVSDNMKEKLGKNATIQYIKNAGHLVQLERPYAYNHYLKKFLSNL